MPSTAGSAQTSTTWWVTYRRCHPIDLAARLGGDEFAVLLPDISAESTKKVAEKLQRSLQQAMQAHGWPMTFSIGAISCKEPSATLESILHSADMAMYASKKNGKDSITGEEIL